MSDVGVYRFEPSWGSEEVSASQRPSCMIVEDQALIALSLEAYLEEMGLDVGEPLMSTADALEWLAANTPTVAILDYSLRDGPCIAVIDALRARSIPFVIYSGHKPSVAPKELQNVPWLVKPCDRVALLAALTNAAPVLASRDLPVAM
jgi:DNA-binding NtrC family response regulator